MTRKFNFSAGPATLPLSVLKKAQQELLDYDHHGMSIMEMSHRSKAFDDVLNRAKSGIINLYHIPDVSGVGISLDLIERLIISYPNVIAGIKDSSGNWKNTEK